MVQNLITSILASILQQGENLNLETSSFLVNYLVLNSSNLAPSINMQKNVIQLPSFCNLTNEMNNCSQQSIILKVSLVIYLF